MDLEFSPNILDTPSLMTPNITETPLLYRPSPSLVTNEVTTTTINDSNSAHSHATSSSSTISNIPDESSSIASSEDKLSEIKNDLKQSITQTRLPTESPFFSKTRSTTSVLGNKVMPAPGHVNHDLPTIIPSTAEIVSEIIESFEKDSSKETAATTSTTTSVVNRSEIHSIPNETTAAYEISGADAMGVIVSPKKRFIIRSQSRTDCTSPNPIVPTQSQKSSSEEENFTEDNPFQRAPDATFEGHSMSTKRSNIVFNEKRSMPNEVTSSDPTIGIKRQKIHSNSPVNFRSTMPSETIPMVNDDQRKKQIRDSNREAARRCRERRRQYIEQLEATLEQHKNQIKQLSDKLISSERENAQLKTIITEMKILQTRRMPSNETIVEYSPMVNAAAAAADGNLLHQRNFHSRTTH